MTNPSEQSIEVRQQILDTLWLTEELLETPAHISITSNDINRLVALVDKATREAVIAELERKMTLHVDLMSSADFKAGFSAALDQIDEATKRRIEELSNKGGE